MKKSILNTVKPYEVNVNPLLLNKVYDILKEFNIEPVIKVNYIDKTLDHILWIELLAKYFKPT